MSAPGNWADLGPRLASGLVMVVVGLAAVWAGGLWFHALVAVLCGLMAWELARIVSPGQGGVALGLGALCGGALLAASHLPGGFALPLLLAAGLVGFGQLARGRAVFLGYMVLLLLAGYGMVALRDDFGFVWMFWLVSVVVASDVAGYFVGKSLGGPRFWPRVSPKKTWSGTVAGWVGAAVVGILFALFTSAGAQLIGVSVAVAMAAQTGDIAESAVKRAFGVKDSSNLIPGHGGVLDRFDAMMGAALLVLIAGRIINFLPAL